MTRGPDDKKTLDSDCFRGLPRVVKRFSKVVKSLSRVLKPCSMVFNGVKALFNDC